MRNLLIGVVIGLLLGGGTTYAALRDNIQQREYDKFVADSSGDTAIRAVIVTE